MTRVLRRLADASWLSLLFSAVAILDGRLAPAFLLLAVAAFFAGPLLLPPEAPPWLPGFSLLLFLFACAWTVYHQPGAPLDLFEDGLLLAPAQAYGRGARPYLDTYPFHGWGADGGLDAFLFRLFPSTLKTFRIRRAIMTSLALPCLALSSHLLFDSGLWAGVGLLLSVTICPFLSERQLLALVSLCVLLRASRGGRPIGWAVAGGLAGAALFYSLDFGLVVLAGGAIASVVDSLLDGWRRWPRGAAQALAFAGGAATGSIPFLLRLWACGALPAFLRVSFVEIPATAMDTWGLPAGSASAIASTLGSQRILDLLATGKEMPALTLILILTAGTTILLFRAARGLLEPVDRAAAVWLPVAAVALRGAVGRADEGHLALYGTLFGPPAAWILYRAARSRRPLLLGGLVVLLLAGRLHPRSHLTAEWQAVTSGWRSRAEAAVQPAIPRGGGASVPIGQAHAIEELRDALNPLPAGQTFFDFANAPALYFLFDRRLPVRYACAPLYETEAKQNEVIDALEREKPPLALLGNGRDADAFDGVSNRERLPRVAAYLDAHYEPAGEAGGLRIWKRRP
jgi:hypothetical protein